MGQPFATALPAANAPAVGPHKLSGPAQVGNSTHGEGREAGERDRKALRSKVSEMLEVMEMEGQEDKMPESLSGGMKKRVGLARAIIRRPSCVLYDEPTAGLDPVVADSINRLIRRLQQRFGMTSAVVTHDMKSAFDVADRIAYLHEGRVYFHGTATELQQSNDALIQDFLLGRAEPAFVTTTR